MKFEDKIGRREFLKQGACWGMLVGLLSFWPKVRKRRPEEKVRPAPAKHWHELAG